MDWEMVVVLGFLLSIFALSAGGALIAHYIDHAYPKPVPCKTCPECHK